MAAQISQKVAVGAVFVAAMFMSILDVTIVNVALPTIGRDFGVSATAVDGIAIAFLVSLAVTIPASGWLGDRYGGKRVMLAAIALFTAASALCGMASSLGELVAFRILQGAGAGMLAPVGMAMLYRVFPPDERIKAAAILTVPTTFAPALGPVLGGCSSPSCPGAGCSTSTCRSARPRSPSARSSCASRPRRSRAAST